MKTKPVTILGITILIIVGIIFFVIRPVVSSLWSSWNDLEKAKQDLTTVDQKKVIFEELSKNPDIANIGQIASKYIPKESESGQLVIQLTAIAQANNLKVEQTSLEQTKTSASPTPEEDTSGAKKSPTPRASGSQDTTGFKELAFSMKLSGNYSDFMNFLKAVDTSDRLISIKTLSLIMSQAQTQTPGTSGTPSAFNASIAGVAYYKPSVSITNSLDNIKISEDTIKKFLDLKSYGLPINLPTESGFGRNNPFEGY